MGACIHAVLCVCVRVYGAQCVCMLSLVGGDRLRCVCVRFPSQLRGSWCRCMCSIRLHVCLLSSVEANFCAAQGCMYGSQSFLLFAGACVFAVLCECVGLCCALWLRASLLCPMGMRVYAVLCACARLRCVLWVRVSMLRCVAVRVPLLCKAGACVYAVLCWGASFSAVLRGCASVVFCGCPCRCCPLQASVYATLYVCVSCMLCSV